MTGRGVTGKRLSVFKLVLGLLLGGSIFTAAASPGLTPCVAATLSAYDASFPFPTGGCAIGILDYYTFTYHGISNAPSESAIELTPIATGGFSFTRVDGQPFTASLGQTVQFEIDYNILIDPAPIIEGSDLNLDPPSGNVVVTEFFCNDSQYFFSGFCFGGPLEKLSVGTQPPLSLSATINFANPAQHFEEVGILFTLDGTNGPSSFDGLDASSIVVTPEPMAAASTLLGLAALAVFRLRRRQRCM